ncbi:unnamed protein product [Notodromas monacha]|uniref:Uncharacterized protein n=1 Tax=Notodromas monacha TaxID=399045 RepID=A0A7R9C1N8_9CRUS|nr:unnamed protein product [Notodromas monacha]CAG0925760.1 unnamed protein product [Notodromas monacha]
MSGCLDNLDIPLSNKRRPAPVLPETAKDLIKRVTEEVNIDASCQQKAKDHLGRDDVGKNVDGDSLSCRTSDSGAIDSLILDEDVEAVAARYVAEAELEKVTRMRDTQEEMKYDSGGEELPFCTICNKDATIRCVSCQHEGDSCLFCVSCFHDMHDDDDKMKRHRIKAYKGGD